MTPENFKNKELRILIVKMAEVIFSNAVRHEYIDKNIIKALNSPILFERFSFTPVATSTKLSLYQLQLTILLGEREKAKELLKFATNELKLNCHYFLQIAHLHLANGELTKSITNGLNKIIYNSDLSSDTHCKNRALFKKSYTYIFQKKYSEAKILQEHYNETNYKKQFQTSVYLSIAFFKSDYKNILLYGKQMLKFANDSKRALPKRKMATEVLSSSILIKNKELFNESQKILDNVINHEFVTSNQLQYLNTLKLIGKNVIYKKEKPTKTQIKTITMRGNHFYGSGSYQMTTIKFLVDKFYK